MDRTSPCPGHITDFFGAAFYADVGVSPPSSEGTASASVLSTPPKLISKDWLTGKRNWHVHAEELLRDFMREHDFWNYHKTDPRCDQLLDAVVRDLRRLFDDNTASSGWGEADDEALRTKVRNKMHRIRAELQQQNADANVNVNADGRAARDKGRAFRNALDRLQPEEYEGAFGDLVRRVGLGRAEGFLRSLKTVSA